jgi:hypothetical protein
VTTGNTQKLGLYYPLCPILSPIKKTFLLLKKANICMRRQIEMLLLFCRASPCHIIHPLSALTTVHLFGVLGQVAEPGGPKGL